MSFDSLLQHRVTIERPVVQMDGDEIVTTEFGQYETERAVLATAVPAQVQPLRQIARTLREVIQTNDAGVVVGDYRIYMRPRDISTADLIAFDDVADWVLAGVYGATEDTRLEVLAIRNAAGRNHHLELEARVIVAPHTEVEGS